MRFIPTRRCQYRAKTRIQNADILHNLLLGTVKHMITEKDMDTIQSTVDSFITPSDVGSRISSGYSGFTAILFAHLSHMVTTRAGSCLSKVVICCVKGLYI